MAKNTGRTHMARLINKSSLGTPAARSLRSRTPRAVSARIVHASTHRASSKK